MAVQFNLSGTLDAASLQQAINATVQRYEILRTGFTLIDGEVSQVVLAERPIELPITDLSGLPEPARAQEVDRWTGTLARVRHSAEPGPLLLVRLLRLHATEHLLLLAAHRIIADVWPLGAITRDLGAFYAAHCSGQSPALPEPPAPLNGDALSRREQAASEQYWRDRLAALPRFELLPDFPRDAGVSPSHTASRLLPTALTAGLGDIARHHGATVFTVMYAGLCTLLHRYTGESDIVLGAQVAGHDLVEIEPLTGPSGNTLVLRTAVTPASSFPGILERARETVSGAIANQLPLGRVAEPLPVNLIYQRDFVQPWNHAGLSLQPIPSRSPDATTDLNFFLVEGAAGWRLSCDYNSALYRAATVESLLENLERLLAEIVRQPAQRVSAIHFLSPSDEAQLLVGFNRTATPFPGDLRIHDLLDQAALRAPHQTAVVFEGSSTSYETLHRRVNQLARYLSARGATPGALIGVCVPRSTEMLIAVLAILKAGCAYVPLDPAFPPDRLAFMGEDAALPLIVTTTALAHLGGDRAERVFLDSDAASIALASSEPFDGHATSAAAAFVLFTSGSTGKPKGVLVPHRSVINLLHAIQAHIGIGPRDTLLALTTLSFDIAGLELFLPLLTGARILLASQTQASDPASLLPLLESSVTVLQATPVTWRILMDAGWRRTPKLKMLCGGEAMPRALADALLQRGGPLWNVYGPTETTIWSTIARIEPDGSPITIGRPLANTLVYVLDPTLSPVPIGVAGELYIGGDGVALGYLNRTELTAERFLTNPFAPGRMYRTGDRARFLPGGNLEMLGRNDHQVKVRGFRIELGEVESALAACPAVRAAAVVVRPGPSGDDILAGYFVPRVPGELTPAAVRAALAATLPEYMIPTVLMPMDELPVTPNGKLDRKALPAPRAVTLDASPATDAAPAAGTMEATLAGVWESVLGVHPIRPTDNFFALGGHSLLAARMFARLEKVIGRRLPLATLFQAPTIQELAAVIHNSDWTPLWSPLVPIRPAGSRLPFFFVHPIGGNVLNFAGFASHFHDDQPVYGIQARGLDGKDAPRLTIDEMAADYVDSIRAVQPNGPYSIGGFSAGAIVAFEMARLLQAQGQQISILALLDSELELPLSARSGSVLHSLRGALRMARFNLRYAARIPAFSFVRRKAKNLYMRATLRLWRIREVLGLHNDPSNLGPEEGFMLALRHYTPRPYNGDATLFRAMDEIARYPDPYLGWRPFILGKLEVQEIRGDHDNLLLEPQIGFLAERLEARLHR